MTSRFLFACPSQPARKALAIIFVLLAMVGGRAKAGFIFVGQYAVYDGPSFTTNPTVYSAREAAALLFGGTFSDYAISTNSNTTDPTTVNHMAWVDGWANTSHLSSGTAVSEDFKVDVGTPGYSPGDFSAYVRDHGQGINSINYVWRISTAAVPEPSTFAFLAFGFGIASLRRKPRQSVD